MSRTTRITNKGRYKSYTVPWKTLHEQYDHVHWSDRGRWRAIYDLIHQEYEYQMGWRTAMSNEPSHWHRQYSTRPRRAKERALAKKVVDGKVDYEDIVWPLHKKPHNYYW